jgi:predicted alpha/beta hydrolase family esterase
MIGTVFASSIGFGVYSTIKNKLKTWLFSPEPVSIANYVNEENLDIIMNDNIYYGWRLRRENNPKKSVVFFMHGNSGCSMDYYDIFKNRFQESDVICVEYPGFGWNYNSGQTPTLDSCAAHVRKFYDWFVRPSYTNVYVMAFSIGTVVVARAFETAMMDRVRAFILLSPIDDINSVVSDNTSIPLFMVNFLLNESTVENDWNRILEFSMKNTKFYVLIANQDQIVLPSHSVNVVRLLPQNRTEVFFVPTGHNELINKLSDNLWNRIKM